MITAEFHRRGRDAILVPIHVRPEDFATLVPQLKRIANLDGLVFTIPYKQLACAHADALGPQARIVGAINALARRADGRWVGEIFDGIGCVEAFRRAGHSLRGRGVMLIGAGGAGSAIGVAVAREHPRRMRLFDIEAARSEALGAKIARVDPAIEVEWTEPDLAGIDILINASPVGMLEDPRLPIEVERIPPEIVVFDAIVKPEPTRLLELAARCGCPTVRGREMMHGQIGKVVDFFAGEEPAG